MGAGLFLVTLLAITLARGLNILCMTYIANKFRNRNKIVKPFQYYILLDQIDYFSGSVDLEVRWPMHYPWRVVIYSENMGTSC